MSNYTKTTDFEAKDSLPTGDSGKIIRGAEFETEFDAISTAIATKADTAGPTFTGTLTFETISDGTIGVTAFVDEDDMSSDSATLVPTQQSVKAYVDSQVTAQDLDFQADSGGALSIDLDSETLTFTGGTGVDTSGSGNAVTFAIDSTVATLTGTQTLTNKTLTSPDVNTPDIDGGTIDGTVIGGTTPAAVSATTVSATGNITVGGTVDGRDVATDGTKLDGIESGATADQTAAEIRTLVESATDSNVFTDADHTKLDGIEANATADQTDAEIRAAVEAATDSNVFTDADHSKLDGIEAGADVTDTTNVTAAGALMDSEVTNLDQVKAFDSADYATAAQGTTADAALPRTGGAMTGAITTNSTFDGRDVATDGAKLDGIEAGADVTDTANVTAAGAVMDSELTNETAVKALNQGVATTDSPTFAGVTVNGTVEFDGLSGTGSVNVTDILDQDDMSSNSATALATQQSIKAYVDSQVATADTLSEVLANGNTTGGTDIAVGTGDDITFADSSKAIFGAGSDLEIYHSASHSIIADVGTGDLLLRGNNARLQNSDGSQTFVHGFNSGAVEISHSGNKKFETTSSGIDVTGSISADGLTVDGNATITTADNSDTLTLISTDADASAGPNLKMYRNSASPADSDELGNILFQGRNDNSQDVVYATIETFALDVSDGTEDAVLNFNVMKAGSSVSFFKGNNTEVVVNDDSNDLDFRVESDSNSHMLFVDAGNDRIGINQSSPERTFHVQGDAQVENLYKNQSLTASSTSFVVSNGVNTQQASIAFWDTQHSSYAGQIHLVGRSSFSGTLASAGELQYWTFNGSSYAKEASFGPTGYVFNEASRDADFRVESDTNTHLLFADAVNNRVNIGTNDVSSQGTLAVNGSAIFGRSSTTTGDLFSSGGGNNGTYNGVAILSNSDEITAQANTSLSSWIVDVGGRAADGVTFPVSTADSFSVRRVAAGGAYLSAANYLQIGAGTTVFNEDSNDQDFRVESDGASHMLFVDAGNNRVGIGESSPDTPLHVTTSSTGFATTLESTNAGSSSGPSLLLYRNSASPASNDFLGQLVFRGRNSVAQDVDYAKIYTQATRAVDTDEKSSLFFETMANGSAIAALTLSDTENVFNDSSAAVDFRVESDNNTHMLFVDAGANHVIVGGSVNYENATLQVQGAKNLVVGIPQEGIAVTDTTAVAAGVGGGITFNGVYNSGGDVTNFASIEGEKRIATSGHYDGVLVLKARTNGTNTHERARFDDVEAVINGEGRNTDFRVESSGNANMLFVDAGNDHVNIGTSSDFGGVLNVNGGAVFDDATTFDPDTLGTGRIAIGNVNDGGGFVAPGICWGGSGGQNAAIVSTAGVLYLGVGNRSAADNLESVMELRNTEVTVNQLGADQDFRVESDSNAHGFFLDASTTSVGVNHTSSPGGYAQFAVRFSGSDSNVNTTGVAIQDSGTNSNISFCTFFNSTGGGIGSITRVGTTNAVNYNTTSDRRAKENIADADDAGAIIDAIQVRKFDWIEGNQHQPYGMIAQELVEHAPEVVHQPADEEDMMGVDYSKLVPMLIKEIQSLRARVAQLESN